MVINSSTGNFKSTCLQRGLLALSGAPLLFCACREAALLLVQLLCGGRQLGAGAVQLSAELRLGCRGVLLALRKRMLLLRL